MEPGEQGDRPPRRRERVLALPPEPERREVDGPFGWALAIDVEEWFHTCHVTEYVVPTRRPPLVHQLDRLLPELLQLLAGSGRRATFFVLGEVAERLPGRIREVAAAGHEVASHGYLHLRVGDRVPRAYLADLVHARELLEDVTGAAIAGYRAPEWSLRHTGHPYLRLVVEAGYRYDSSLAPCPGSGRRSNPRRPTRLDWSEGLELVEVPPLTWGGPLGLPACGWTGRSLPAAWLARAAASCQRRGGLPLMTVHPWELSEGPTPGELTGFARFLHEAGRAQFRPRFCALLGAGPWTTVEAALARPGDEPTRGVTTVAALAAGRSVRG